MLSSGQGVRTHHHRAVGRVAAHIPLWCLTSGIILRRHSIRIFHRRHSIRIFLRRHFTRMSHIRNSSPPPFHPDISHPALEVRWERRAFQLLRSDISGSSDSAYPESFADILHSNTVFSWSFPICAIDIFRYFASAAVFSWSFPIFAIDIWRYFALDIWCLNPKTFLVTHQL